MGEELEPPTERAAERKGEGKDDELASFRASDHFWLSTKRRTSSVVIPSSARGLRFDTPSDRCPKRRRSSSSASVIRGTRRQSMTSLPQDKSVCRKRSSFAHSSDVPAN